MLFTDNPEVQQHLFKTQQQLNSYARQGLRVLLMGKRQLTENELSRWLVLNREAELAQESRDHRILESYAAIETGFHLLGKLVRGRKCGLSHCSPNNGFIHSPPVLTKPIFNLQGLRALRTVYKMASLSVYQR